MVSKDGSEVNGEQLTAIKQLKKYQNWLVWREEERDGKPTKIPYNPETRGLAKSNDAATWTDFETAVQAYKAKDYDGIGFVFSGADPFCGIDLDSCRDPETGQLEPWAQAVVDKLRSYTEVSPSGTGLHILIKGELPPGRNRTGALPWEAGDEAEIEMYDSRRYFTITGDELDGTPGEIKERQKELEKLHGEIFPQEEEQEPDSSRREAAATRDLDLTDRELIERAKNAENGRKLSALWNGDTSGYKSHSEADQALCNLLAFWTDRDAGRMDKLFRQSGLNRDKWEQREDYRERTIGKAIEDTDETYNPQKEVDKSREHRPDPGPPPPKQNTTEDTTESTTDGQKQGKKSTLQVVDANTLLDTEYDEEAIIGDGVLAPGRLLLLAGPPKTGKSLLLLDFSLTVADPNRERWLGFPVERHCKVLYLSGEGGPQLLQDRMRVREPGTEMLNNLIFWWPQEGERVKLDSELPRQKLINTIEETEADILIVDPLVRFHSLDENSTKDMARLCDHLLKIREETEAAVILCHHTRKSGMNSKAGSMQEARGSSVLHGEVDTGAVLDRKRNGKFVLDWELRWAESPETQELRIEQKTLCFGVTGTFSRGQGNRKTSTKAILAMLEEESRWCGYEEIATEFNVTKKTVSKYIQKLEAENEIKTMKQGREKYVRKR